jgi:transcription elongation factor GreA
MSGEKAMERLNSLFKEEQWGRIEPKDIGISKFKILDDLFNYVVTAGQVEETLNACKEQLEEHRDSITASYLIGLIGYHEDRIEDSLMLRKLIDIFIENHKWAVVEIIAEKILEYGESSIALRALAVSLERMGRSKEAIPVWESLLKIDRFDAEVSKKLSFAIIDEDPEKSVQYMKLSIEGYIKNTQFDEVITLWNKLVSVSWEDLPFFERVERQLLDARQKDLASMLLKTLLGKYKEEEDVEVSIELLKKILQYKPLDNHARRELIKLYSAKYGEHSQYEQFLKLSKLEDFKFPIKFAIQDFEKNIVFDKGNYVFHNSWKLGKIQEIDSESLTISFPEKPEHKMSIKMALQSLLPIAKDHIYVMEYEDPEMITSMFRDDFMQFFMLLVKSYGGEINLNDVKAELIPKYVASKEWAKWWSKARTKIKKDPIFGVSDKTKNLIFMRDKPLTFADELLDNFTKTESFSEKLDISIEFINNINKDEGASVVHYFIDYFTGEAKGKSSTRQILSYFILKDLSEYTESAKVKLDTIESKVIEFIKGTGELHGLSLKISSYDYKKQFINIIQDSRDDWAEVVYDILFELPVRIHKYIINTLIRSSNYEVINRFIDEVMLGEKHIPEIMVWVAKNILTRTWDYDWLTVDRNAVILSFFRLLNELKKTETDSNRVKNMSLDLLFDNEEFAIRDIIKNSDEAFLGKIYNIFDNLQYVEDSQKEKLMALINEKFPEFGIDEVDSASDIETDEEKFVVSKKSYDRKKEELDRMVNEEMVNLSKELAKVAEVSGDLRENVEYTALLEKQSILKMAISKLDNDMKKVSIINMDNVITDSVCIGIDVSLEGLAGGDTIKYSILGPWDADFEAGILSYRSPIAKSMLGKKIGDEVEFKIDDAKRKYKIVSIDKCG